MGFVAPGVWSVGATRVGLGHFGYSAVPIRHPGPSSRAFLASARSYAGVLSTRTLEFCRYPVVGWRHNHGGLGIRHWSGNDFPRCWSGFPICLVREMPWGKVWDRWPDIGLLFSEFGAASMRQRQYLTLDVINA